MTVFVLGSDYTRALDHFAGYGLSAILEEAGERDVRLHWSNEAKPKLTLSGLHAQPKQVAEAVHEHALAHNRIESWVQRTTQIEGTQKTFEVGLFSPRIGAPGHPEEWVRLYKARRAALDMEHNGGWLDSMMLQALGEPAYWLLDTKLPEPDRGASRWEMKTRNRGEDFTRNRLALLAKTVAARTPDAIASGLSGAATTDEAGKDAPESRSGTGFVLPGPVDNAVAWCALWGLSSFRLTHRIGRQTFTPGADPQTRVHPAQMVLPIVAEPTSPAKLRRILRSRAFDAAAFGPSESPERAVGRETLRGDGVTSLVTFKVRVAGSPSAPERQILAGSSTPV